MYKIILKVTIVNTLLSRWYKPKLETIFTYRTTFNENTAIINTPKILKRIILYVQKHSTKSLQLWQKSKYNDMT